MTKLLDKLRQATAADHQALENTPPFNRLMTGALSEQHYAEVLAVLHGFHREIARVMEQALTHPVAGMLHCETILHALAQDRLAAPCPQAAPFRPTVTLSASRADIYACGYVWLGSSMGGKMLARWLSEQHPELPVAYYTSLAACSKHWAEYRRYVSGIVLSDAEIQRCCLVARALFQALRSAAVKLTDPLHQAS